jgi:hypothetical protein
VLSVFSRNCVRSALSLSDVLVPCKEKGCSLLSISWRGRIGDNVFIFLEDIDGDGGLATMRYIISLTYKRLHMKFTNLHYQAQY